MTENRPIFPERAVITAGMPYGNKELHLGHIGGVFIHADTFARFLRDRIGKENVIFVSGTDCYGSPIFEHYRNLVSSGVFEGTINEFVQLNHKKQKEVLDSYHVAIDLFAASSFGPAAEIHRKVSSDFIRGLYSNGHLVKMTTSQFYDTELEVFLNGRQVAGQCPIAGCTSERSYADECSLGHQYMPVELINPKSTLTGKKPEMRDVTNWYLKLDGFHGLLTQWVEKLKEHPASRHFVQKSIQEFLEPPVIYLKRDQLGLVNAIKDSLPEYTLCDDENKPSVLLVFDSLIKREKTCSILAANSIRYRTGKTLVPFRLTGNIEWGVSAPSLEGLENLTVWVWPESLWAPISFTMAFLELQNRGMDNWKDWWCSKDSKVYQFMGEDNIYFYGPAEMAIFMGTQGKAPSAAPLEGELQLPELIVNNHILFLDKKASSSGQIKPPMAGELLNYYTAEQLRAHFLGLGLGIRSVGFQPKPLNPKANEKDGDPVLKEGNLLSNALNRAVRSCFYTAQKYYDGKIPVGDISTEILAESHDTILEYEKLMYRCDFHQVMSLLDTYIRSINKHWSKNIREAEANNDMELHKQVLVDAFHMVRTAIVLTHPIAPVGTEMVLEYLDLGEDFGNWDKIFEPIYAFMNNPDEHKLKFLEPRIDFFKKHPGQIKQ
ncbi:MAG: class I tRNA ligase family protein [Clostridia bacterium]